MLNKQEVQNAALEAVYWWNRAEGYYYKYFSRLGELYEHKELFQFFKAKAFDVFLREYSIRRNIAAGYEAVDAFIEEIIKDNFVQRVIYGDVHVIDEMSDRLSTHIKITNRRQTRSLLSKVAFLINPAKFSLYDTLAKNSIWDIIKNQNQYRKHALDSYSLFIEHTERLIIENAGVLSGCESVLCDFVGTDAQTFFSSNKEAFHRRILDKLLWLRQANKNGDSRPIDNNAYKKFIAFHNSNSGGTSM